MRNRHFQALVWLNLQEKIVLQKYVDIFRDNSWIFVREHKILNLSTDLALGN